MRIACYGSSLLMNAGTLYGLALGADYCAEHEWGIRGLLRMFGVSSEGIGVVARKQTRETTYIRVSFDKNGEHWEALMTDSLYLRHKPEAELQAYAMQAIGVPKSGAHFAAAWDERSFGICVSAENVAILDMIANAIDKQSLVLGFNLVPEENMEKTFGRRGLMLLDADFVPQQIADSIEAADKSQIHLYEVAFGNTNIEARLKAAGLRYYALSPSWDDEATEQYKFWLNPMDQAKYDSGWVTLQDLEDWICGKGIIIK